MPRKPLEKTTAPPIRPIDRKSPLPYYYQLQEILREGIEHGLWNPGELLPSESEMTVSFGVSRTAIRQALDVLEAEGRVFRIKGKGTLVAEAKFEFEAVRSQFPTKGKKKRAIGPRVLTIIDSRLGAAGGQIGRMLDVSPEEPVFEFTDVESLESVPAILNQMFVRTDASEELSRLASNGEVPILKEGGPEMLLQLADQYGAKMTESHVTLELSTANSYEASFLDIRPKTPVLQLASLELSEDGAALGFTRSVCRSDQFQFSFRLSRHES